MPGLFVLGAVCTASHFLVCITYHKFPANEVKEAVEKDFTAHLRALRKKKRLRGTPGTQRGQAWLASNRSYVDTSLDWSANLKTMADSLTAESAKNNCEMPSREQLHESMKNICQGVSVAGQSCYYNWAIMRGGFYGLSALPSTDEAFQQLGMPKVPAGYEQVGCSDCLKEASSNNKWGYWSGVCLYYVIAPANIGLP